jgi:hypothetical protein
MFNALEETKMDQVQMAMQEAHQAAATATNAFLAKHGDRDACGFAWVTVYEKGSTKIGRALLKNGFRKAYGGGLQWWNPSGSLTQCITAKEEGAYAAAKVLTEKLGVKAYAGSRMD